MSEFGNILPVETIQNPEGVRAEVNLNGGYLETLTAPDGTDILFPRQDLGGKDRGGVFLCLPFGPSIQKGMEQHGFARRLQWEKVDAPDDANAVTLQLDNPRSQNPDLPGEYEGCSITLRYEPMTVTDDQGNESYGFTATATITNNGAMPFVTAPAFHPYLPVAEGSNALNGRNSLLQSQPTEQQLDDTIFVTTADGNATYSDGLHIWKIAGEGLQTYAVWSNRPDTFVCVEPSMCGDAERQEKPPTLAPGETMRVSMALVRSSVRAAV